MARKSRKAVSAAPIPKQEHVWRAALYIRLSNESNNGRGASLETQRQIMEAYTALCPDIEIAGIYTDNGITGRTFEREAFQQMLQDMESGKINCVVVKDLSRLGRNSIDTGFYVEKYFPLRHIRLISVNDQYDSEENDNNGSHILVPLKNMMNEAYAADIGKKVRSQRRHAMLEGAFIGARPPYGYQKDPNDRHHLLVDETTAPVVRQIFQWVVDGVPVHEIVKRLNENGVATPGYYWASIGLITSKRLAGSGKWQSRTVRKILTSEVYLGDMVQGRYTNIGHRQVSVRPEDWIVVRGVHEPVVSREMFLAAQAVQAHRAEKYAGTVRTPYSENILRGKVFCGCCGKNLQRHRGHGRYVYRCVSNERIEKGFCTGGVLYLPEDTLFQAVLAALRQEARVVIRNSQRLKQCGGMAASQKTADAHEISELCLEIQRKRAYQASLYQDLVDGVLNRAEYMGAKENYNREIRQAAERVCFLRERQCHLEQQMEAYFALAERLSALDEDTVLTASLVEETIERVTVDESGGVSIQFRFDDAVSELMGAFDDEQE